MSRVPPFSAVKSVIAQMVLQVTSYPAGKEKKSNAHWSRWTYCASWPGSMLITWVRWSWNVVAWPSTLPTAPVTVGCMTSWCDDAARATSPPVRRVRWPLKSSP